ncbi:hypothetical protein NE237_006555 [Protea cynaroides]|uniref:V-type proton ATPase subunit n=2 Tax=Magnoliopsida TaxID=3398 RepID=A0A9Q0KNB4_9MAGN|nr:hypothetical protein NE237_006555 [Protea cynaroides]
MYGFEALTFNVHGGYLEAIVRGHRSGLLTAADYNNLCQCETLEDIKMHLSATEYGPYLQNEPSPLHTTTIVEKCTLKLVDEYKHMLCQATEPLSTFLEYITYGHMIDNVVLIVTGTLHERDVHELLEKCHPLGMFDSIATLAVAQNMRELYRLVLVDTPLAPYFSECITSEDLDDMNIEIMRNTLYKAYLEDFYRFCQKLGGATAEIMSDLLSFEADRRAVNISINSIGTELTRDDRRKLYSSFGLLYPYGHEELAVCEDIDQVRAVMEKYPPYQSIFAKMSYGESQMLDKAFYEEEVKRQCLAFEQQFHYGVFFAYMRLREQEIRNLMWISECSSFLVFFLSHDVARPSHEGGRTRLIPQISANDSEIIASGSRFCRKLKKNLNKAKEAYSSMAKVRKEWESQALLAIDKVASEILTGKKSSLAKQASILLMIAHDGFSASELCLHYLFASSNLDELTLSSSISKLDGSEMLSLIRYMGKWLRKYERFPQAGHCPTAASVLGLKACDWVPSLESIVKYLGLVLDEHFSSLVLYSEFHEELRSMEVVMKSLGLEARLCCSLANVIENLRTEVGQREGA